MPLVTTRRRCFVCNKFMEIGEKFVWGEMRAHGIDRTLPMHPEHDSNYSAQKAKLEAVKAEAAANGHDNPDHHIQGEVTMSQQSLVAELKNEIERGKKWGYTFVTHDRLSSMIRMHEVQVPGDISEQPGEWQIRGGNVEAIQHDGTRLGASLVRDWVRQKGGTADYLGLYDQEVDHTRVALYSPRQPNIVNSGWWVVKTADNIFYTMPDSDFHTIYVPKSE